jgi:hypothetical protein
MQTNTQPTLTTAPGLRPENKPMLLQMSGPFVTAAEKVDLVNLVNMLKHVFLRLGFDGYRYERGSSRLRLYGHNLNTGRYCDNHAVNIGIMDIADDFTVGIEDRGGYYAMSIRLADEQTQEAA